MRGLAFFTYHSMHSLFSNAYFSIFQSIRFTLTCMVACVTLFYLNFVMPNRLLVNHCSFCKFPVLVHHLHRLGESGSLSQRYLAIWLVPESVRFCLFPLFSGITKNPWVLRPVRNFFQCLPRFPHFDARFAVASCRPDSTIGRVLFAAINQNSQQLNLFY